MGKALMLGQNVQQLRLGWRPRLYPMDVLGPSLIQISSVYFADIPYQYSQVEYETIFLAR